MYSNFKNLEELIILVEDSALSDSTGTFMACLQEWKNSLHPLDPQKLPSIEKIEYKCMKDGFTMEQELLRYLREKS
jgi:hypothetical protein